MFLVSYSVIFTSLGKEELSIVNHLKITNEHHFIDSVKANFYKTDFINFSLIQKCNGSIILIELLNGIISAKEILNIWGQHSCINKDELHKRVVIKYNEDAVQYVFESAIGIHSVTPGDSQVYSQVRKGILKTLDSKYKRSIIKGIYRHLPLVLKDAKKNLDLFRGNTSLERIACNQIRANIPDRNYSIAIIGYGSSGQLISKILNKEMQLRVDIYCRKTGHIATFTEQFFHLSHLHKYNLEKYKCIILCVDINSDIYAFFYENFESTELSIKLNKKLLFVNLTNHTVADLNENIGDSIKLIDLQILSIIANKTKKKRQEEFNAAKELVKKYTINWPTITNSPM